MKPDFDRALYLPPQISSPSSTQGMMRDVLIALLPSVGLSTFFFGLRVLILCAVSVASCVASEYLYRRLTHQSNTIGDLSACVTGLLLAMCLPASAPYAIAVLGGVFSIVVVKQFYGGLGKNFMNPALAGWMLLATFPKLMTTWSKPLDRLAVISPDVVSSATPMSYLSNQQLPPFSLDQLFLGYQGGCLGEVSSAMLLLGGIYLILRDVISPRIPLAYIGTVAALTLFFAPENINAFSWVAVQVCSGGLLLGAFFMATDPTTSPVTPNGQLMFGISCGALTVLLRYCSSYPEGVGWAILTMNSCVWLFDRAGRPRRFGEGTFSYWLRSFRKLRDSVSDIHFVKPKLDLSFLRPKAGLAPGEAYLDLIRTHAPTVLSLGGTVVAMGFLISLTYHATALPIAQAENRAEQELLNQVMPNASFSSESPYRSAGALDIQTAYDKDNQFIGYCVEVQSQGFGGIITMMVGVDLDGKVTGVAVTGHSETPSVAQSAMTPASLKRYVGRSGTLRITGRNAVNAVSGATATSNAITSGVNRALSIIAKLDPDMMITFEESETES